ncbi:MULTISPECIES: hypothetical protein [Halomonadaceae]|uniref:hypothetical protein n=1 Tax=Halomonadaceae TaxID=28256 RepID=UPI00159A696C|nr:MULTISPECIES: hypothetical protein [Halomonas]QJQ93943.1 hypothetical protein HIO72_00615 [Halomonas sp. PA5]
MNTIQTADVARFRLGTHSRLTARPVELARRVLDSGPASIQQVENARREAEYVQRRNGQKPPLLQLWRVS